MMYLYRYRGNTLYRAYAANRPYSSYTVEFYDEAYAKRDEKYLIFDEPLFHEQICSETAHFINEQASLLRSKLGRPLTVLELAGGICTYSFMLLEKGGLNPIDWTATGPKLEHSGG